MSGIWSALPFALLILAVAVMPLVRPRWWLKYYALVTLVLSLPVLLTYVVFERNAGPVWGLVREYFSFICLIGSLYIIAGGILIRIVAPARPVFNLLILSFGALVSNVIGTTGASMLLIRSYLNVNRRRFQAYLIPFFIFVVANIGGGLTPIGDPPLFLGYINGVPFFWVMGRVWYIWLLALALVLGVFYALDRRNRASHAQARRPLRINVQGYRSLILLAIVLIAVFARTPVRELVMIGAAAASYFFTRKEVHRRNRFSFRPIIEVAVLFAGLFVTMAPVLRLLELNAARLGLSTPGHYFWATGILSGFLDNTPTYRVFLELVRASCGGDIAQLLTNSPALVKAISLGAVFFGAMTYIGNGPNFMVKSIAEHRHLKVPHFFEYMVRFSLPILLPVFVVIRLLFLR